MLFVFGFTQNGIVTGSKDQTVKFWKFELARSPEDDSGRYNEKLATAQIMCQSVAGVTVAFMSKSLLVLYVSFSGASSCLDFSPTFCCYSTMFRHVFR